VSVVVIEFITLDGIVTDPDGSGGTPAGGWAFRYGREAVAGDMFRLGSLLDEGVLLLGRKTWELFSRIWPGRDDPFSARMNAVPKLVATRTLTGTSAWANSQVVDGDVIDTVKRQQRDVVIMGSLSVVHTLMANDLIDEYRRAVVCRWATRRPGARVGRAGRRRGLDAVPEGGRMTARFLALL